MIKDKIIPLVGALCFLLIVPLTLIHLNFFPTTIHHTGTREQFLSLPSLWMINMGLGLLGGISIDYKHVLIAGLAGLIASIAMTGTTLLYLSFRSSIMSVEILFPMLTGLVGIWLYDCLIAKNIEKKKINKPKEES